MKIAIIAGHGGIDTGAAPSGKTTEADINLDVALELERLLKAAGYETVQYRSTYDTPKGMNGTAIVNDSAAFAGKAKADLAIHIHHNSGGGVGSEIWAQVADEKGGLSKTLGEALLKQYNAIGQISRGVKFRWNSANNADYFGVLRGAKSSGVTAVISEFAFLDTADYNKVDTLDKRKTQAAAIAKAIQAVYPAPVPLNGDTAIDKLASVGVITAPDYWKQQLKTVKYLDDMFIKWAGMV